MRLPVPSSPVLVAVKSMGVRRKDDLLIRVSRSVPRTAQRIFVSKLASILFPSHCTTLAGTPLTGFSCKHVVHLTCRAPSAHTLITQF